MQRADRLWDRLFGGLSGGELRLGEIAVWRLLRRARLRAAVLGMCGSPCGSSWLARCGPARGRAYTAGAAPDRLLGEGGRAIGYCGGRERNRLLNSIHASEYLIK